MPFMDGYDSTSNIKKLMASMDIEESKQPTIYGVTGHVEKEYVKRAIDNGMERVFAKPLKVVEFGRILIEHGYIQEIPLHIRN